MVAPIARTVFLGLAVVLTAGLFVQVFLAGLGVFAGGTNFAVHRDTGYGLTLIPVLMVVVGLVGRVGRTMVLAAFGVFAQFILQSVFVAFRSTTPAVAALHPVNGFLMLLVTLWIVREAWILRRAVAA
jgi:hypothetical protein